MTTNMMGGSGLAAARRELRAVMRGEVVSAGEETYARIRQIWNGAVDHQPALFALCETTEDVQASVRIARLHNIAVSVRGGGHDWAGRSLRHGGLVIDLSRLRRVEVDAPAGIATIGGGATAADVAAAATPFGLAAELSVLAGALPGPNGNLFAFLGPVWSGEPEAGEKAIARMQSLGTPVHSQIAAMSYSDLLGIYDAQVVSGRHYALQM